MYENLKKFKHLKSDTLKTNCATVALSKSHLIRWAALVCDSPACTT